MKFLVNISSIIIMMLSFSSITSAQNQQRPSQRSFAMVLSKIKEKKNGRDRMQREQQQPENKIEKIDPELENRNRQMTKIQLSPVPDPDPAKLPSRQVMTLPHPPRRQ